MFYELQPEIQKQEYKKMLAIIGNLTLLFSENSCPYLHYRIHENVFCKYFKADNLARSDCSADAKKNRIGVGLKTWVGNGDQKIAEFGKLRKTYEDITGIELVQTISLYRNQRIRITKKMFGIDTMIYHIIRRVPGAMQIIEHAFEYIDISNLSLINKLGNVNNTYFTDGRHTYHFSVSKNTLYMLFEDVQILDYFEVDIMSNPYDFLMNVIETTVPKISPVIDKTNKLCLRLYSTKVDGTKFVPQKSGLNQWNASGRKRDPDEIYIAYQASDRNRDLSFFPPRDTPFTLHLPDGTDIPAKVCQVADKKKLNLGKAIMSNPNKILGKWLLRDVFEIIEGDIITYEMLERFGIDSVVFTKISNSEYIIDFSEIGTYEAFYEEDIDVKN